MLLKRKPVDDTPLKFAPMGAKPVAKKKGAPAENEVTEAKAGKHNKKEEAKEKSKTSKKKGKPGKFYAAKAAAALAGKK